MKKFIIFCLISILLFSLCACGQQEDIEQHLQVNDSSFVKTKTSKLQETSEEETTAATYTEQEIQQVEPFSYTSYLHYLLENQSLDANTVFSSESLHLALGLYSQIVDSETAFALENYLQLKDYLNYQSSDVFKIVNRLWVNDRADFNIEEDSPLYDLVYRMNMFDSVKATKIKNDYVSEETDGFITETPTIFDSETILDIMNVIYFKDTWLNGDKDLDTEKKTFYNADGTTTDTYMMTDVSDGGYMETKNAKAYSMMYQDGFMFTAVLPDEGVNLEDVDIEAFINGDATFQAVQTHFYMPEFEISSTYEILPETFNIPIGAIRPDVSTEDIDGLAISQVAKIEVDHEGTEAAAVTEMLFIGSMATEEDIKDVDFICDRPFLYYITDTMNNDIAFMGIVNTIAE